MINKRTRSDTKTPSFMYLAHKMEMESVAFEKEGPSQNQSDQC